jgi:uncharacterized membrane protein
MLVATVAKSLPEILLAMVKRSSLYQVWDGRKHDEASWMAVLNGYFGFFFSSEFWLLAFIFWVKNMGKTRFS